jgi:hypothetical protein
VDKQLIKDEILTELRQMVQSLLREPRSADRVRAKTLLKISVAPSLKTDLSALIAAAHF